MSVEQGDVEAIRDGLRCARNDNQLLDGRDFDEAFWDAKDAALDRLAAVLEREEQERLDAETCRDQWIIKAGDHKTSSYSVGSWTPAWEDMRAYNIRLEERAREAERALDETREALRRLSTKDFPLANRVYWMREFARAALPSEDTSDES